MTFNLLDEPWIPVLFHNGALKRLGVSDALRDARNIRTIATPNPMDRFAVFRFLLALVYWGLGNPPEDKESIAQNGFPDSLTDFLNANRDCFELFGEGKRFLQTKTAKGAKSVNYLIHEHPTGTSLWHFRHLTDKVEGMCPACVALGLLRLPLFFGQGGAGYFTGINGQPPIYGMLWGKSLSETLAKNWLFTEDPGVPCWQGYHRLPDIAPIPLLVGFTALPRKVWISQPVGEGQCCKCGELTSHLVVETGFEPSDVKFTDSWTDPHVLYQTIPPEKATPDKARRACMAANTMDPKNLFEGDRPFFPAIIAETIKLRAMNHEQLWMVGYTTGKASSVDAWEATLPLKNLLPPGDELLDYRAGLFTNHFSRANQVNNVGIAKARKFAKNIEAIQRLYTLSAARPHLADLLSQMAQNPDSDYETLWVDISKTDMDLRSALSTSVYPGFTTGDTESRRKTARLAKKLTPDNPGTKEEVDVDDGLC